MIVEHLFGVWIACIRRILFELCLIEKKEEERRKMTKKNKIQIFTFNFLDCEKSWDCGVIFDIRIAKGFHL